jgi:surfeit locus 1 family protein
VSPRLRFVWITAASLASVALTLSLGAWQLSRAAQKEALHATLAQRAGLPAISAEALLGATDLQALLYRHVSLSGQWLAPATVYLENRQMNGRPGFYVVTPLRPATQGPALLVMRGWIARNFQDRSALAPVSTPAGEVRVSGLLVPPPSRLLDFGAIERGPIRQNLDLAAFQAELGLPLMALAVQQVGAASDGLLREWPAAASGAEKNRGYAFQWFALAGLVACLYVWFQVVRPLQARRRPAA